MKGFQLYFLFTLLALTCANLEITRSGSVYIDEVHFDASECEETCAPTCVRYGFSSGECFSIREGRLRKYKCKCIRPLTFNICSYVEARELSKCRHGRP